MNEMKIGLTPTVILCFIGGAILGLILGLWTGLGPGAVFASTVTLAIIAAIGGTFI